MNKTIVYTEKAPAPIGPYSQAILTGDTLYVSGQIALHAGSGQMQQADISSETEAVMRNLEAVLHAAGMALSDVVKCSIFVTNMADFPAVNAAYASFFRQEPPARETVEVAALPKGANVEISCIAVK
jgi:2-iminobutanoate/2-iminopropanoate deaminase